MPVSDQDDEAVERELADHERPVVGEDLVRARCGRSSAAPSRSSIQRADAGEQPVAAHRAGALAVGSPSAHRSRSQKPGPTGPREVAGGDRGSRRRRRRAAAAAASGRPGRRSGWRRRARRTSTGGTGTAAGPPRPGTARPGSRRGCTASSRRRCRRRVQSSRPGQGLKSWSGRVRMSSVGASAASVWPSGNTVITPSTARSSGLHRLPSAVHHALAAARRTACPSGPCPGRGPSERIGNSSAAPSAARRRRPSAISSRRPADACSAVLEVGGEARRSSSSLDATGGAPRSTSSWGMNALGPHHDADADAAEWPRRAGAPRAGSGRPASTRRRGRSRPPRPTRKQAGGDASRRDGSHRGALVTASSPPADRAAACRSRTPAASRAPMPTDHATKPSGTGPMRPMGSPPGSSGSRRYSDVARRARRAGAGRSRSRRTPASGPVRSGPRRRPASAWPSAARGAARP